MKQFLLLLSVFFLFGTTALAQDLSKKSKQELEQMKTQAVKEQNFQLAENIKTELNSRRSIDDQINDKKTELYEAAKKGDMAQAEALKNEVQRLEKAKSDIAMLEEQLKIAVKEEQYGEAQQLKLQIENLKRPATAQAPAPAPANRTVVAEPKTIREPAGTTAVAASSPNAAGEPEAKKSFLAGYKVTLGLTFGDINFKDATGNGIDADFVPTLGYMLGLAKDFPVADNILVQPGVALVGFGSKVADQDYTYNIHYLSLHGTTQYKTPFKAYVGLGLFLDFGLFGNQGYPSGNTANIFENGGFVRMNSGLNVEAGYPLSLSGKNGDVFISYRKGLNNVEDDDATEGQTTKLNLVTIGVRYAF